MSANQIRHDFRVILEMVPQGAKVLDLACGNGELLHLLGERKQCSGSGVEINQENVLQCVEKGLSVHHGDIDEGLGDFPDASFDLVILSQSLQEVKQPDAVLKEMLRVGKKAIVSFPNVAHYSIRLGYLLNGRTASNPDLPYDWYETPNIHACSVFDFKEYCRQRDYRIESARYLSGDREVHALPNWRSRVAIFLIEPR